MNRFSQDASQSQSTAYFYIRQQLWATLGDFCDKQFDNINDPFFAFWRAFAYFKEDKPNDAINVLTSVKQRKEIEYATIQALKFYHKKCDFVDDEAIQQLRYQEEESRKTSSDKAIILAAYFFLYLKEEQKALDYLEMVQVKGVPSQTCEGWIFLLHSEEPNIEKAFEIFQNCLESQGGNMKPIDTQMGFAQAAYSLKKKQRALKQHQQRKGQESYSFKDELQQYQQQQQQQLQQQQITQLQFRTKLISLEQQQC